MSTSGVSKNLYYVWSIAQCLYLFSDVCRSDVRVCTTEGPRTVGRCHSLTTSLFTSTVSVIVSVSVTRLIYIGVFPKLRLNKFAKLVKLAKTFNHLPKL